MDLETIEEFFLIKHTKYWFLKFERLIASISLVGGFIFDIYALPRVDEFVENAWIGSHLLIAAVGIVLLNLFEKGKSSMGERKRSVIHFWLIVLMQFAFGGLLSAFLVFYFRSATLAVSWPFFVLLVAAFIANEALKKHFVRLTFQISLFFLSLYAFAIYVLPIVFHRVDDTIFLLSGIVSLVLLALFLFCLRYFTREQFRKSRNLLALCIGGLTLAINLLYFGNFIPPIPLSLQDAGIFHSFSRASNGTYVATAEPADWKDYFKLYEDYSYVPGEPVYVYSAIFSPTHLDTQVIHVWQHYDETTEKWISAGMIELGVVGGRDGGYRTYSMKSTIVPGRWRVDVENARGQLLGRIRFNVVDTHSVPVLITAIK